MLTACVSFLRYVQEVEDEEAAGLHEEVEHGVAGYSGREVDTIAEEAEALDGGSVQHTYAEQQAEMAMQQPPAISQPAAHHWSPARR